MGKTTHYYKTILKRGDVEAEYSSETDEIYITIDRRIKRGDIIRTEHLRIHRNDVLPFTQLMQDVLAVADPPQIA